MARFITKTTQREAGTPLRVCAGRIRAILARGFDRLIEQIGAWNKSRRDRYLLAGLNDRNLRDIGLESAAIRRDDSMSVWFRPRR